MPAYLLETVVGFIVWLIANVVYLDMKRTGTRGFRRFLAFWFGAPSTSLTLLLVRPDSHPRLEPPPDDEEALLAAIRRDRECRVGPARAEDGSEGPDSPGATHPHPSRLRETT
ncbi:MAG: hypothetical protein RH859_00095 [Longimicrobiales bacterium]